MIFKKITINNKYLNIKNIELDFSKKGIYIVTGENGVGKSTLFKTILFGSYCPVFTNPDFYTIYEKCKYKIVSYISQDDVDTSDTVFEFLTKHNPISTNEIKIMMTEFKLSKIDFNQGFTVLSGGEKRKLQIISALLKKTPYIILDEPTNSDRKSVV